MASTALELPEELRSDKAWNAVLHVLERAFPNDPRVWKHVSDPFDVQGWAGDPSKSSVVAGEEWGIDFEAMLAAGTWSGGEKMLLKAVASLFHPDYAVNLWELAHQLSENNWTLFTEALAILRGDE